MSVKQAANAVDVKKNEKYNSRTIMAVGSLVQCLNGKING
jgi:hypothetical protein